MSKFIYEAFTAHSLFFELDTYFYYGLLGKFPRKSSFDFSLYRLVYFSDTVVVVYFRFIWFCIIYYILSRVRGFIDRHAMRFSLFLLSVIQLFLSIISMPRHNNITLSFSTATRCTLRRRCYSSPQQREIDYYIYSYISLHYFHHCCTANTSFCDWPVTGRYHYQRPRYFTAGRSVILLIRVIYRRSRGRNASRRPLAYCLPQLIPSTLLSVTACFKGRSNGPLAARLALRTIYAANAASIFEWYFH